MAAQKSYYKMGTYRHHYVGKCSNPCDHINSQVHANNLGHKDCSAADPKGFCTDQHINLRARVGNKVLLAKSSITWIGSRTYVDGVEVDMND